MKETVTANIGSEAFILDSDAYRALQDYFDDIRSRLPKDDSETMGDIEIRMAELFHEKTASSIRVVTLDIARVAMNRMGAPGEFGARRDDAAPDSDSASEQTSTILRHRIYRSRTNRSIAGICGGVGEFFDIDPTLLRIITLLMILFGGLSLWVYLILWVVIPNQPISPTETTKKR